MSHCDCCGPLRCACDVVYGRLGPKIMTVLLMEDEQ